MGSADAAPDPARVLETIRKTRGGVVVNLLGVKLADRPASLAGLLPELLALRARFGCPHFVVADEAHHMLPAEWDPAGTAASTPTGGCATTSASTSAAPTNG